MAKRGSPLVSLALIVAAAAGWAQSSILHEDSALDAKLHALAAAHRGEVAVFAQNLRTGETASIEPDRAVKTASTIKLAILLDAAEQVRAGKASLDEKLVLTEPNQVEGSGVLSQLTPPIALTLRDVLMLMVVLSDNTATNMAIDRLGLAHIDATLQAAGLRQTWLYKKVYVPASGPMPADQAKFGLGKSTPREMASIMERFAECQLGLDGSGRLPGDGVVCGAILKMLRGQHDRDSLPRYLETLDTSEQGTAIANKTGALKGVRNDVGLIASKSGPIVIAAFTDNNRDQRWTGDNEAEQLLGKVAEAVVDRWSPAGLDAGGFPWDNPLQSATGNH